MVLFSASSFAAIVPQDRLPNNNALPYFGLTGVPGGIPNRTTIFVNVATTSNTRYKCFGNGTTDNRAALEAAINDCPAGQVVYVPAGTYRVGDQIRIFEKSHWTLRGDGPGQTIIVGGGDGLVTIGNMPWMAEWPAAVAITGGATRGSTNITVASTTGFAVDKLIFLEQQNDGSIVFGSGSGGSNPAGDRMRNNTRNLNQRVMITGISGNQISFYPPLNFNFNQSLSPTAVPYGAKIGPKFVGIESMTLRGSPSGMGVWFMGTYGSWLKNVEITQWNTWGVEVQASACIEVRDSYIHEPAVYAWSRGYPYQFDMANNCLTENNIFWKFQGGVILQGCSSGNVFGYNLMFQVYNVYNGIETMLASAAGNHTPYPTVNLWEGNYMNAYHADFYYGPSSKGTLLRNYLTGTDPDIRQNRFCVNLDSHQWHHSVVGNILGSVGTNAPLNALLPGTTITWANTSPLVWGYDSGGVSFPYSVNYIFRLGYPYIGNNSTGSGTYPPSTGVTAFDLTVKSNTIIHGNWDYSSKTVKWDPAITDTAVPNSYYLPSKPAWFGNLRWPPYDSQSPTAATMTNLPAGYRFVFRNSPGQGPVNGAPVVSANATPTSGMAPLPVVFTCTASDPEGGALTYAWTFGDGTSTNVANCSKTYANNGTYVAYVTVSDGTNSVQSSSISILVGNQPPVVSAAADVTSGAAPLTVSFTSAGTSDPEGTPLQFNWTFGDSTSTNTANPRHVYAQQGSYTARLSVSDGVNTVLSAPIAINVFNSANGLVAAYSFDEGNGNTVADATGNNNTGTLNNANWIAGVFGNALSFNGTNSVVTANDSASLDLTGAMTVMAWVYPTASGGVRNILYKDSLSYYLVNGTTESTAPGVGGSFATPLYGPAPLPLNTWSHVAGTFDGSTIALYVNGVQVATRGETGPITVGFGALMIGGNASTPNRHFAGRIDELRIYNRALGQSEISQNMNIAIGGGTRPSAPQDFQFLGSQ